MLRITNAEASQRFYNHCLGMYTIFIFNNSAWTINYSGLARLRWNIGITSGLLELFHIPEHLKKYKNGNENGG
jgi:hypothetical protein